MWTDGKAQTDEDWKKIKKESDELALRMKQWFEEVGIQKVYSYYSVAELPSEVIEKVKNKQGLYYY